MHLALFDVDGTVLRGNSWQEYFWWTLSRRPGLAPGLLASLVLRRAGCLAARALRERALRPLRGLDAAGVRALGASVFDSRIRTLVRPSARRELARCRAEGCELVLATGAFDFLAAPLAAELGVREVVCTQLEWADGICTGRIAGAEARGMCKAEAVRARFAGQKVDWARSRAFSDDLEDTPLFALVGEPVLVRRGAGRPGGAPRHLRVVDWESDP